MLAKLFYWDDLDIAKLLNDFSVPNSSEDPRCCDRDANFPECFPIIVSKKDAFYALFKKNCLNVVRSVPGVRNGCKFGKLNTELSGYAESETDQGSSSLRQAVLMDFNFPQKEDILSSFSMFVCFLRV